MEQSSTAGVRLKADVESWYSCFIFWVEGAWVESQISVRKPNIIIYNSVIILSLSRQSQNKTSN